jgi:hypothetical protein
MYNITHQNSRIINLTDTKFCTEHINILNLGFDNAIEQHPQRFVNTLIVETENAIRHLDTSLQGTYRHLVAKKIKQIMHTSHHNLILKRHQYNLKQIRTILGRNNLTVAKADKGKTMVIINRDVLRQTFDNFIQNNNMLHLNKDPTEQYQKQISQVLPRINISIYCKRTLTPRN